MSALVSTVSSLLPSVAISLPFTVPVTVMLDDTSRAPATFVSPFKLIVHGAVAAVGPTLILVPPVVDEKPVPMFTVLV